MGLQKHIIKIIFCSLFLLMVSCQNKYDDLQDGIYAELVTSKGIMLAKLYYKKAPYTVANFISLSEGTNVLVDSLYRDKKFYNGTIFYRVIDSFMIQGGDPLGNGFGNPGYRFDDEFHPDLKHNKPGILGMANDGPKTNGSQFYITKKADSNLDSLHAIFGELILGFDVLDSISKVKTSELDNKPIKEVNLKEVNIIRIGLSAAAFDAQKTFTNYFTDLERSEKRKKEKAEALIKATQMKFDKQLQDAVLMPSGLEYVITIKGEGEKLKETSKALVHYSVYFADGKLIETSNLKKAESLDAVNEKRKKNNKYKPIKADLSPDAQMISGFKEGLQQLSVGDKATFFIPFYLAYGETGSGIIPPKSNLIFEVEILELLN